MFQGIQSIGHSYGMMGTCEAGKPVESTIIPLKQDIGRLNDTRVKNMASIHSRKCKKQFK